MNITNFQISGVDIDVKKVSLEVEPTLPGEPVQMPKSPLSLSGSVTFHARTVNEKINLLDLFVWLSGEKDHN